MHNKTKNIKLKLSFNAINQGEIKKKALIITLLSASMLWTGIGCLHAESLEPITLNNNQVINNLRKFYNSPAKDLNKLINKTNNTPQGLPVYSYVKGKSYIDKKPSDTKPIKAQNKNKFSLFNWITNNNQYSKFGNDPFYSKNVKFKTDKTKETAGSFDYSNIETSVITLRINNKVAYDFEVIIWPDGSISVPIKTLAELVDVPVEQNHVNHNLSFTHPFTKDKIVVDYEKSNITVGVSLIEIKNPKLVYIDDSFVVKKDIYVPEKVARDLLDIKTKFLQDKFALDLNTNRVLKAIIQLNEGIEEEGYSSYTMEESIQHISEAEKESKIFKLKNLRYSIGSSMNQTSSYNQNISRASARAGFMATGKFLGGDFNVGANTNYSEQGLALSGYRASLDYIKPKYELSLGATNTRLSELAVPGANIWGFRFGSVGAANNSSFVPKLIEGQADDNSIVELYINDVLSDKQMVQNGHFEFDSMIYPSERIVHVVVKQIGENGNKKIIYDRKFSQDSDLLAPGQKQFLVFSGIDNSAISQNFYLFGDKFNRSYVQPVKFISGAKYRMGISENVTVGVNFAKDFIIRQPSKLFQRERKNLTTGRIFRTGRSSSGSILTLNLDYVASEDLRFSSELGFSSSNSKIDPEFDPSGTDFGGFIEADYHKRNYNINVKAFSYGPNFYSPGAYGYIDKRGVEVNSSWNMGPVNFNAGISRYNSNLDNYFAGGQSEILDYNLYASGQIDKYSSLRAGVRSRGVKNSLYYDRDTTFDVTIDRKLSDKARLVINYGKTIRKNRSGDAKETSTTSNNRLNAELTYDADKFGIIRLSHEMMALDPVDRLIFAEIDDSFYRQSIYSKNIRLTLDRSRLPIKGFTLSPNIGYRYGGQNKGVNFGLNLGYIFRSGRQLSLTYAYNSTFGKYMTGALSFGGSKSHSLSFNFMDTLGFGIPKGINTTNNYRSSFDNNSGIIKGCVYLDLNQNGVRDPGEEGMPEIDIYFNNLFSVTTDKDGNYIAANIPTGLRKVGIDKNTLPVIYTPTVADALVKVKKQKVYVANLGLIVTPGSVSGKVISESDDISNREVVVVLINKEGKEITYTTTDSAGTFYIGSIPPGDYTLQVDENYQNFKSIQMANNKGFNISIPMVTDDFVDIENVELKVEPKRVKAKQF